MLLYLWAHRNKKGPAIRVPTLVLRLKVRRGRLERDVVEVIDLVIVDEEGRSGGNVQSPTEVPYTNLLNLRGRPPALLPEQFFDLPYFLEENVDTFVFHQTDAALAAVVAAPLPGEAVVDDDNLAVAGHVSPKGISLISHTPTMRTCTVVSF